jgi:TolB-like protein
MFFYWRFDMKKCFFGIIPFILLLASCAGSAKPANNSAANSGGMTLDQALKEAADRIDERIAAGSKIASLNFNSPHDKFSGYVLDELTANLVDSRKLTVVDRKEVDLIRSEFDFQFSGDVGDDSMQELGRMLGAQSIISGSLTDMDGFYRIVIRVLNVQSASVEVQYRANIVNDTITTALLTGGKTQAVTVTPRQASSGGTATSTSQPAPAASVAQVPTPPPAPAAPPAPTYKVGDTGPGGGIIFYDKGNRTDGWRYLEAAPSRTERSAVNSYTNPAPIICDQLIVNGFDDWYLPNLDELMRMYASLYLNELDNFKSLPYFSSEMAGWGNQNLKAMNFKDGSVSHLHKDGQVRAIRRF